MRAVAVRSFGEPLVLEDRPDPEPGPGQVRVRLKASGLCHTDIHAAHGDWPVKPSPPFVAGHEGVGSVESLGDGVTGLGHPAVQYAKIAGATVAAIDVTDDTLAPARELGAIDARGEDPAEVLKRHGGAHAAVAPAAHLQARSPPSTTPCGAAASWAWSLCRPTARSRCRSATPC